MSTAKPDGRRGRAALGIAAKARELCVAAAGVYAKEINPALREAGVRFLAVADLEPRERAFLDDLFAKEIFPVLTPAAIDSALPFPHVTNLALYLAVRLEREGAEPRLAILQLPRTAARWIQVAGKEGVRFVLLEDIIREHIGDLFEGHVVAETVAFRVTRDADFATDDQEVEDLVDAVRLVLKSRLRGDPVRVEVEEGASAAIVDPLTEALGLTADDASAPIAARSQVPDGVRAAVTSGPAREAWPPQPQLGSGRARGIFERARRADILLFHPYESFEPVIPDAAACSRGPFGPRD